MPKRAKKYSKQLKITQMSKITQNCSKGPKIVLNDSKYLKMFKRAKKMLKIVQNVSKLLKMLKRVKKKLSK